MSEATASRILSPASTSSANAWRAWWPVGLAAALCLAIKVAQHRLGFDLGDEGFLWYGAQRVLAGELPLRDFQAYDPGRYWWSAAWMWLFDDDGLLTFRWSNSILAAVTVGIGIYLIKPLADRAGAAPLVAAGLILALWVRGPDSFAAMLLLLGLARLVEVPSPFRFFGFGLCWGVAAVIGINHALYGAIAGLLAFLYVRGGAEPARAVATAAAGAIMGYAPVLALHVAADGFTWAFIDSIRLLFEVGTTNLTLPLPRPWAFLDPGPKNLSGAALESVMGVTLVLVPALWGYFGWRWLYAAHRAQLPPATVAGVLLSVPYGHYVWSRADEFHWALSALPLLVAGLAWGLSGSSRRAWLKLALVGISSLAVTAPTHPAYDFLRGRQDAAVDIDGARLRVSEMRAEQVLALQRLARAEAAQPFFAGPYLPGAYALARQRSPTWENYMLFPSKVSRQQAEVERLRAASVRAAVIDIRTVDNNSRLGIRMTHPLIIAYFAKCHSEPEWVPSLGLFFLRSIQDCP